MLGDQASIIPCNADMSFDVATRADLFYSTRRYAVFNDTTDKLDIAIKVCMEAKRKKENVVCQVKDIDTLLDMLVELKARRAEMDSPSIDL